MGSSLWVFPRRWRRFLPVAAVLTVIIAGGLGHLVAQTPTEDKEEGEEEQIERRREWFFSTRRAGTESESDLARLRHAGVLATNSALKSQRLLRSMGVEGAQNSWISMGPSPSTHGAGGYGNVSGRVTSIAADWAGGKLYAGTASGGLWRSTDDGLSWTSLFDSAGTQTVGTVAIDPNNPNVIWVGTGENEWAYCEEYFGIGLLRSGDGGLTWEVRNGTGGNTLDDLAAFANVIVNPRNSNRIVTGGKLRGCSDGSAEAGGLYTSNDGGLTWVRRLADTSVHEISRDPAVLDILWAGTDKGIYKSVDNGVSWTLQTSSGLPHGSTGRTELAIAPSDGNTVYALFADAGPALWRTTNGGVTWTQMSSGGSACDGQCGYNMVLRVHPTNPDVVYRGTVFIFKSLDGGANWTRISLGQVHADTHALLMAPGDPDTFYVGCDGGIWKSIDGGDSFINRNGNLNVTQFYAIDVHAGDPGVICGGAQDNSSLARTTSNVWDLQHPTGDGMVCHIDPQDANYAYVTSYGALFAGDGYPTVFRSTTGLPGPFSLITGPGSGINPGDYFNWVTPYLLDPEHPNILYLGTHRVYRSADHGDSWTQVGPPNMGSSLLSLEINPNFTNVLYSGSAIGKVWRTVNSGTDWVDITTGVPARSINDIASDPANSDRAFAVVGGFNTPHLWEWTAGAGWVARGSGLPNVPANTVLMLTDSDILVGTDTGIFQSRDGGVTFHPYMDGLPEGLVVTDLKYNPLQSVVTAGTYGRGAWQVNIEVGPMPPVVRYDSIELPIVEVDGDGDVNVEGGETWSVRPILKNRGDATAVGVQARLATPTAGVTILDGGPRPYGDIAPGATSAVASAYRFALDPSWSGSEIAFDVLDITSTTPGAYPDTLAAFSVLARPVVRYDSHSGLTEIDGNGNGVVEPGETWQMSVNLRNDGATTVGGVSADLTVDPATPGSVFLLQDSANYATINAGQVVSSLGAYRFRVGDNFRCGGPVVLSISAITSTDPARSYPDEVGVIRIPVGNSAESVRLFYDGFEPTGVGPFWTAEGEWEGDRPRGLGGPQADPPSAFEGQYIVGTDLTGLGPNPGNYENGVASSLYSPIIPVSGFVPTEIRFARWINLAQDDLVTVRVYSDVPGDQRMFWFGSVSQSSWLSQPIDISDMAGNKNWLRVQFLIESDAQGTSSGWNMDNFEVWGFACQAFQRALPGEASSLRVREGAPRQLTLEWSADCGAATSYGIYRGDLRVGYDSIAAEPGACDVTGNSATIPLGAGDAEFFLVVPNKDGEEGSYGTKRTNSPGAPRQPAVNGCWPQGEYQVCVP